MLPKTKLLTSWLQLYQFEILDTHEIGFKILESCKK